MAGVAIPAKGCCHLEKLQTFEWKRFLRFRKCAHLGCGRRFVRLVESGGFGVFRVSGFLGFVGFTYRGPKRGVHASVRRDEANAIGLTALTPLLCGSRFGRYEFPQDPACVGINDQYVKDRVCRQVMLFMVVPLWSCRSWSFRWVFDKLSVVPILVN